MNQEGIPGQRAGEHLRRGNDCECAAQIRAASCGIGRCIEETSETAKRRRKVVSGELTAMSGLERYLPGCDLEPSLLELIKPRALRI